jgi:hypothetical protein
MPSPKQIEHAMSAAMRCVAELGEIDDARLIGDTLEGETDVFDVMDQLAEQAIADDLLVERGQTRLKRIEARSARIRATLAEMLDTLSLRKAERAFYTASLNFHRKPIVTGDLPEEYMRQTPDMRKLDRDLRAGKKVQNAELSNAEPRLTLRTL